MLSEVSKRDGMGGVVDRKATEHTPRRTGAQFHARRGLALWQIQYIGRWGGSTVEVYVAEALAEVRAAWSSSRAGVGLSHPCRSGLENAPQWWGVETKIKELLPLV